MEEVTTDGATAALDKFEEFVGFEPEGTLLLFPFPVRKLLLGGTSPTMECIETIELELFVNAVKIERSCKNFSYNL